MLKLLANAENSEFTKEMENDIKEIVLTIDPELQKSRYNPINACESLEILNNFALLDKTLIPILKNGAIASISHLLKQELKEDEIILAEKGLLSINERLLAGALGTVTQLIGNPEALKSNLYDDILKNDINGSLVKILQSRQNNSQIVQKALSAINKILSNDKTKEDLLGKLEKGNVVDNLIDFLERYPENPQIAKDSNNILFNLTKASPEVAVKLAKQNFVKNLIKETRVHLKDSVNDSESLRLTKQNLQCMTVLAEIGQTAEKLAIEGGVEFALSILKKENQMNPLLSDEDTYYQLNLASNEQELEKKTGVILAKGGDLESLEEKTIPFYACELLSQMVKDKKKAMVFLNEDGLKEVLNTLQSNITDKNLTLKCLEILKKASENEKLAKILEENNGMNAIFMALNQYPTDVEILDLGGDIINNLGADQLLPQVKSQIPKLTDTVLKSTSDQSVEALTKANVYLSNLLSMPPPLSEEGETLSSNLSVIKALEKQLALSLENPELLASNLLLLTRLGNQGELTKEAIRNSSIPKILLKDVIPNEDIMKPEHGKISELALGALEGMIGGQEEYIKMLDPVKGKEIQIMSSEEKRGNLGKGLLETLKGNNYDLLEEVLNIAELKGTTSDKPHSIKTIEKATGLMAKLCENDSSLAAALLNKGGVSKIKNLFEDMAKKKNTSGLRDSPLKKVGKLISALSRSPEGFQAIIKETDLLEKIVEEINSAKITQEMEQDFEGLKTLSESLKALQALLENNFDKTELIENKVPESLINLILRFNQLPISYLQESPFTEQVLQTAYRTVELLAKDPALARVLGKTDGLTVLSAGLHKAAELSRGDLGLKDPGLKPDLSEEIVGSEEGGDRVIENTLGAFVEFSANAKNAEKLELLNSANGGLIASDIKEILSNKAQNPVIVASGLLLLENCFKASNKVDLKEHLAELKEFEGLTQKLLLQYPKIPLISSLAKNISIIAKTQDPEQLVLEEKQAIKQELTKMTEEIIFEAKKQVEEQEKLEALVFETKNLELNQLEGIKTPILEELPIEKKIITVANSSELMNKLDLVSDSLEDFLKKPMNKITKLEESEIGQLVAAIGNFAGGGKVAQLHNMGVTDGLLGLVSSPNISDILKNESLEALSKLSKDPKLVEKMGENDKLASAIAKGLLENSKKKLNALQKGMVKSQLEAAGNLASNEATSQQLRDEGGIRAIIEMMKNNKENSDILIKCSDALTKLAINDDIINEIISLGGLELIEELYKMYPDLLELLRSFSRLVAILAVNEQVKIKLGEGMVIGIIVEGVKLFQDDLILGVNSCLALGNLSYGYQKNSDNVIKTDFISYTHYYVKKMMKEAELIANVCLFFNSLGFKNSVNKKEMGKKGVMDDLQKIFEAYTSERDLKLNTLKQCFK